MEGQINAKLATEPINDAVRVTAEVISDAIDYIQQRNSPEHEIDLTRNRQGSFYQFNMENFISKSLRPDESSIKNETYYAGQDIIRRTENPVKDVPFHNSLVDFDKLKENMAEKCFEMQPKVFEYLKEEFKREKIDMIALESRNDQGKPRVFVQVAKDRFEEAASLAQRVNRGIFVNHEMTKKELIEVEKKQPERGFVMTGAIDQRVANELYKKGLMNLPHTGTRIITAQGSYYRYTFLKKDAQKISEAVREANMYYSGKVGEYSDRLAKERNDNIKELMTEIARNKAELVITDRMHPDHAIVCDNDKLYIIRIDSRGNAEMYQGKAPIDKNNRDWEQKIYKELKRYDRPISFEKDRNLSKNFQKLFKERTELDFPREEKILAMKRTFVKIMRDSIDRDQSIRDNITRLANEKDHALSVGDSNEVRRLDDLISMNRAEEGKAPEEWTKEESSQRTAPGEPVTEYRTEIRSAQTEIFLRALGIDYARDIETRIGELEKYSEEHGGKLSPDKSEELDKCRVMAAFLNETPEFRDEMISEVIGSAKSEGVVGMQELTYEEYAGHEDEISESLDERDDRDDFEL